MSKITIQIEQEDFGTLAICALRYAQTRHTYMPDLVQDICTFHLWEFSDKDLQVMINDINSLTLFGTIPLDSDWIDWKKILFEEKERREQIKNHS